MSKKLSKQIEGFLKDLVVSRGDYDKHSKNCPKPVKIRYFFAAQRFYKAMFNETGKDVYKELYDLTNSAYDKLIPIGEEFNMYRKS